MAAMKVQGGRMVPAGGEDARRKDWLRNREYRLQEALKSGQVELALGWVSDIQGSAKPGDVNPEKLQTITNALREAKSAIAKAENAARKVVTS
jgi:hypothetical protein